MATQIHFGTSGWRAVMAEEFTFANVRRAVTGIARYVVSQKPSGARVIVGRDPRFLGETFCAMASEILIAHGVTPLMITDPAPTPAISYAVIQQKADGAINFTASHNPPEYNGIKFSTPDGAPALPEATKRIEAEIAASDAVAISPSPKINLSTAQTLEPRSIYLARLKEIVDFTAIKKANLRVVFDPFWGAARGYSDVLLRELASMCPPCTIAAMCFSAVTPPNRTIICWRTVASKCEPPRRTSALPPTAMLTVSASSMPTALSSLPTTSSRLLFDYLVESRGWKNGVAKSVATTNLINAVAKHHRVELHETPVGFKYIGELIKQDKIAIGGEESAGLSIRHHVPEKDGVLAGLLCCEMVAKRGKSLGQQLKELFVEVGSFYSLRENFHLTQEAMEKFTGKLKKEPRELMGRKVAEIVRTDGLKLLFGDGSWVCYRLSGTEPVVRVYSEAGSKDELTKLSAAAKQWISNKDIRVWTFE